MRKNYVQYKEENEQAAKWNSENGFVKLSGSKKQIAWAESIRYKAFYYGTPDCRGYKEVDEWKRFESFRDYAKEESSAKVWINNRFSKTADLVKTFLIMGSLR